MNLSDFSLNKTEIKQLKAIHKHGGFVSFPKNNVLCQYGFITVLHGPDCNGMYRACITDKGLRYLQNKFMQTRHTVILEIRAWLTVAIALAAFIKSFFF